MAQSHRNFTGKIFSNKAHQTRKELQTHCELRHKCSFINDDKERFLDDNGTHCHIQIEDIRQ